MEMEFQIQLMFNKSCFVVAIVIVIFSSSLTSNTFACAPQGKLGRVSANVNEKARAKVEAIADASVPFDRRRNGESSDNPTRRSGKLFAVSSEVHDQDEAVCLHSSNDQQFDMRRGGRSGRGSRRDGRRRGSRQDFGRSIGWFGGFSSFPAAPTFLAFNLPPVIQTVVEHHECYPTPVYPAPAPAIEEAYPVPMEDEVGQDLFAQQPSLPRVSVKQFDWFHDWLTQFDVNLGSDFDGLNNAGFGLRFQVPESLGMDTDVSFFRESTATVRDHMWLGDWNLLYEPIVTQNVRLRFGAGFNWLSDSWGREYGFNLTSSVDCRLSQNWMLQLEGDLGQIGDADYSHGRIHLLRNFRRSALSLGYERYDIGGAKIGGAFTGLQFRF
jgi:hypothetical protein